MDISIYEEYPSINGESLHAGRTAYLVRCAGCNLRCPFCDTPAAWEAGTIHSVDDVVARVLTSGMDHLLLTGGEPLLQPDAAADLATQVLAAGMDVVVETNGTRPLDMLPPAVYRVVDLKIPGATPVESFFLANLGIMQPHDQLKIVLIGRTDYDWALSWLRDHPLPVPDDHVLLSPASSILAPAELAAWIQADRLPYRLHLQIHKIIWGDRSGI